MPSFRTILGFAVLLAAVAATAAVWASDEKKQVEIKDLPEKVMDAFKEEFKDFTAEKAESYDVDSKEAFQVEGTDENGDDVEAVFSEDGKLILAEEEVDKDKVPEKAMAAAEKIAKDEAGCDEDELEVGEVVESFEPEEGDCAASPIKIFFEISFVVKGDPVAPPKWVKVDEKGKKPGKPAKPGKGKKHGKQPALKPVDQCLKAKNDKKKKKK